MDKIGIMQGRLSPRYKGRYQAFPVDTWQEEFALAKQLGFACIEFIYDYENYENSPLLTKSGKQIIRTVSEKSGVAVYSICADYFMRYPFFLQDQTLSQKSLEKLKQLIVESQELDITDITIPCVDESKLKTEDDEKRLIEGLQECLSLAQSAGIYLNLETDLSPVPFLNLIEQINHPHIKINYDIGNSAALGYDPQQELNAYAQYVSVLHIKDRILNGGSVKLGTGDAKLLWVLKKMKEVSFTGVVIMQASRAVNDSEEFEWVRTQKKYVEDLLKH